MCLSISMIQPDEDSVPDEAAQVLAQLTKHEHVRGCVALTAADQRVIWSGGVTFASEAKLAQVVHFVRDTLAVVQRHMDILEADDDLGLMRIRTGKYELLITPSTYTMLLTHRQILSLSGNAGSITLNILDLWEELSMRENQSFNNMYVYTSLVVVHKTTNQLDTLEVFLAVLVLVLSAAGVHHRQTFRNVVKVLFAHVITRAVVARAVINRRASDPRAETRCE